MATETLAPDSVAAQLNYTTINVGDIDEDPASSDGVFGTWDTNGNTDVRVTFPSPSGPPTTGAGLQTFRVLIQRTGAASLGWSLELWENGSSVSVLATGTLTTASATVSGTWDASSLGTADGSLVECRLVQTSGGTGGGRQGIEVGAVAWDVDYTIVNHYTLTADAGSLTLTGQSAGVTAARELAGGAGSFTLTGQAAGVATTRTLGGEAGAFTLTGSTAGLAAGRQVSAGAGAYTLTGQNATLTGPETGYTLTAEPGAFTLTGQAAGVAAGRAVVSEAGAFTLVGQSGGLTADRSLVGSAGAFFLNGSAAGMAAGRALTADAGTFTTTGQAAPLTASRSLAADAGSFTLTGQPATLTGPGTAYTLTAEAGTFTLTGQSAGLSASRRVVADAGTYSLTGQPAALTRTWVMVAAPGVFTVGGLPATFDVLLANVPTVNLADRRGATAHTSQTSTRTGCAEHVSRTEVRRWPSTTST